MADLVGNADTAASSLVGARPGSRPPPTVSQNRSSYAPPPVPSPAPSFMPPAPVPSNAPNSITDSAANLSSQIGKHTEFLKTVKTRLTKIRDTLASLKTTADNASRIANAATAQTQTQTPSSGSCAKEDAKIKELTGYINTLTTAFNAISSQQDPINDALSVVSQAQAQTPTQVQTSTQAQTPAAGADGDQLLAPTNDAPTVDPTGGRRRKRTAKKRQSAKKRQRGRR